MTTAALNQLGSAEWSPTIEAAPHTIPALVEAITKSESKL